VTPQQLIDLRQSNELIYEGMDRNDLGEKIDVRLSYYVE